MKFLLFYENKLFISYLKELIKNNNDEFVVLNEDSNICLAYKKYVPDWILIDLYFKNNNGFKAAEILKSEFPEANIALLSDFNDERLKRKSYEIGAVFIPKENLFEFYKIINHDKNDIPI